MNTQHPNFFPQPLSKAWSLLAVALAASSLIGTAPLVCGQSVISFNEDYYGTIAPAATAGVLSATNWNDSYLLNNMQAGNGNNTFAGLVNSAGATTTLNVTTSADSIYAIQFSDPGSDADGTSNKRLLNGYLNAGSAAGTTTTKFTLTNIPYASYNIIAYFSSDTAGRAGTVNVGTTTYDFSTIGAPEISGTNALFTQTTDTTGINPSADYAVFTGLSGTSETITTNIPAFGGLAGFQVVEVVPEPSTFTSGIVIASAGILLFWRKRGETVTG